MIKKLLLALLVLIVLLVVVAGTLIAVASTRSDDFQVTRSTTIAAPAPVVFDQVNNLKKWQAWSPWASRDPDIKLTYSGPESGTGATYAWTGNREVGTGKMTITESHPHEKVQFRLDFLEPFAATNTATFTLTPEGDKTNVTWNMSGKNNIVSKVMCMLMDMDKMIGGDFEKGLSAMKSIAEKEAASTPAPAAPSAPPPAPAPAPVSNP